MLRLFKTWLILILITAVPLHAATAGVGLACASAAAAPAFPAMSMDACERHASGVAAASADAAAAHDSGMPGQHTTCSACSALCMGAFLPPSLLRTPPAPTGAENVSIANTPLLAGFIPDGLRRPPRRLHA